MNCACHDKPMGWQKDARYSKGGFWECREKRRKFNAKRIMVFGDRMLMPDMATREFARRLRDERKEQLGR